MRLRGPALHIVCIQHQAGPPRTRHWAHGSGIRKATQREIDTDREADVNHASLHRIALQVERCMWPRHEWYGARGLLMCGCTALGAKQGCSLAASDQGYNVIGNSALRCRASAVDVALKQRTGVPRPCPALHAAWLRNNALMSIAVL